MVIMFGPISLRSMALLWLLQPKRNKVHVLTAVFPRLMKARH